MTDNVFSVFILKLVGIIQLYWYSFTCCIVPYHPAFIFVLGHIYTTIRLLRPGKFSYIKCQSVSMLFLRNFCPRYFPNWYYAPFHGLNFFFFLPRIVGFVIRHLLGIGYSYIIIYCNGEDLQKNILPVYF